MPKPTKEAPPRPADRDAADWFLAMREHDFTAADRRAFELWLQAAPEHAEDFQRIQRFWDASGELRDDFPLTDPGPLPERRGFARDRRWQWSGLAALASLVLVLLVGLSGPDDDFVIYSTSPDQIVSGLLDDGSLLFLNARSEVLIDLQDHQRLLALEQGEAFFEVAHDEQRPFVVQTKDGRVQAVGTAFNVRLRDSDTVVTVIEGAVQVEPVTGSPVLVRKDEQFIFSRRGAQMAGAHRPGIERGDAAAGAWRKRVLVFDNTPFSEAVGQFNRYLIADIRIHDPSLAEMPVSGSFDPLDVTSLIQALQAAFPIRVGMSGDNIDLYYRKNADH